MTLTIKQVEWYLQICRAATPWPWFDQTGNSWRRIGHHGDGDVLRPEEHQTAKGHPTIYIKDWDMAFILAARDGFQEALEALNRLLQLTLVSNSPSGLVPVDAIWKASRGGI